MDGTVIADEFAGCGFEDVALAVGYSEPGSEDQRLALDALLRRLPALPGHNNPPLGEVLDEELAPFRERRDALVETAKTAVIVDDDSAGKVLDLAQMCKAFEDQIDGRRKDLVKPHRDAERLINDSHNRLRLEVQIARQGMNGVSGLRGLLTAWDDKKKSAAAEAKAKAAREARAKEIAAQSAREQLAKAAEAGKGVVTAELLAMQAEDAAAHALVEAEAITAPPTRGQLGQVSRKREIGFDVVDSLAFATWLLQQPGLAGNLLQSLRTICGTHLRSLGVEAVARGVEIPGVVARVEQGTAYVRR